MRVTVSIATMNSREQLRACLLTLPEACGELSWSAVVVDNCSQDGTAAMIRADFPDVAVIENEEPRGFGANHNKVLRSVLESGAAGDLVLILNDDTELGPQSIERLAVAITADPSGGAVSPEVYGSDGIRQPTAFRSTPQRLHVLGTFLGRTLIREQRGSADWLSGCCLLVPVDVLRAAGIFDERFFMYCEDVDLTMRIRALGLRLWESADGRIVHHGAGTTSQPTHVSAMRLQGERSYYQFVRKHRGAPIALAVMCAIRLAHGLRGYVQLVLAVLLRSERRRGSAAVRLALAHYDPRRPVFPAQER